MAINLDFLPKPLIRALIYGEAGSGKSVGALSILKNTDLNVKLLALDSNTIGAVRRISGIHGIDIVREKQFIINRPALGDSLDTKSMLACSNAKFLQTITEATKDFKGIDVFTGKEVRCGNIEAFKSNDVLIIDSLTTFGHSVVGYSKASTTDNKDPRAAFFTEMNILKFFLEEWSAKLSCHLIVLAHSTVTITDVNSSEKQKLIALEKIHPAIGVKSVVDQCCGKYELVFYAIKTESLGGKLPQYYWACERKDTYTRHNLDLAKLQQQKLQFDKLPADFTHPIYGYF